MGAYELKTLLGDAPGAQLAIAATGAFSGYTPLPMLAPHSGSIFALTQP